MLVHHGGKDEVTEARPPGFGEPVATKWNPLPKAKWDIEKIEALSKWPAEWPVIWDDVAYGKPCYLISGVGLYWAIKRLAEQLIEDVIEADQPD